MRLLHILPSRTLNGKRVSSLIAGREINASIGSPPKAASGRKAYLCNQDSQVMQIPALIAYDVRTV